MYCLKEMSSLTSLSALKYTFLQNHAKNLGLKLNTPNLPAASPSIQGIYGVATEAISTIRPAVGILHRS